MNVEERFSAAIRHYWYTRFKQKETQGNVTGIQDYGARADVTGGKHMDGFADLICELRGESGIAAKCIYKGAKSDLPGYVRPVKDWDMVVVEARSIISKPQPASRYKEPLRTAISVRSLHAQWYRQAWG